MCVCVKMHQYVSVKCKPLLDPSCIHAWGSLFEHVVICENVEQNFALVGMYSCDQKIRYARGWLNLTLVVFITFLWQFWFYLWEPPRNPLRTAAKLSQRNPIQLTTITETVTCLPKWSTCVLKLFPQVYVMYICIYVYVGFRMCKCVCRVCVREDGRWRQWGCAWWECAWSESTYSQMEESGHLHVTVTTENDQLLNA